MQRPHLDRDLVEMVEEYHPIFHRQFFTRMPQQFQIIPIEEDIVNQQEALPYEKVSNIIENSQSFAVFDCICKKEKHILGEGCEKPLESYTAYAPISREPLIRIPNSVPYPRKRLRRYSKKQKRPVWFT
jgi:hypothetical protein